MNLSAIVIARNESRHIVDCVASLRWADEVIVCDTGSDDDTVALARQAGARVIPGHPFENYAQTRNAALDSATRADWILFVDADERATPELGAEIQTIQSRGQAPPAPVGYWVPRHNYILGKLTLGAG